MRIFIMTLLITALALIVSNNALAACPCCAGEKEMSAPTEGLAEGTTLAAEKTAVASEKEMNPICPVMGGKANKDISYEYQGKTYYFCCPACIEQFKANPEKYIKLQETPVTE